MKVLIRCFIVFIFSLSLIACGGSDGDGDDVVIPSLPSDATPITATNASDVALLALNNLVFVDTLAGPRQLEDTTLLISDAIRLIIDSAFNRNRQIASRTTDTIDCGPPNSGSGTITFDYDETANSETGSVTFNNCDIDGAGIRINGRFNYNAEFNSTTGAYSESGSGRLTITLGGQTAILAMNYSETGDYIFTGNFSSTMSISLSGDTVASYLMTTTQPITGNSFSETITGGEILVQGAGGTRLRITVIAFNLASVELDNGSGTFALPFPVNF